MANWLDQLGEMTVLNAVFGPDGAFTCTPPLAPAAPVLNTPPPPPEGCTFTGEILVAVDLPCEEGVWILSEEAATLPEPAAVPSADTAAADAPVGVAWDPRRVRVHHLPPITLAFELPPAYPSHAPPHFSLRCLWLTDAEVKQLTAELAQQWQDAAGSVVLYQWVQWLRESALTALGIAFPWRLGTSRPVPAGMSLIVFREMLVLHNEEKREEVFRRQQIECLICFDDLPGTQCYSFSGCEHAFCRSCLRAHYEASMEGGAVTRMTCPHAKCTRPIYPHDVRAVCDRARVDRYEQLLLNAALSEMGDAAQCPRLGCGYPIFREPGAPTLGVCSRCQYAFCMLCRHSSHGVAPCLPKDLDNILKRYSSGSDEDRAELNAQYGADVLARAMDEARSVLWLSANATHCPQCSAPIQKRSGCNKVVCGNGACNAYMCYICGKLLARDRPYLHFSDPASECFGRLMDRVTDDADVEDVPH